jgi:hypothetical protein
MGLRISDSFPSATGEWPSGAALASSSSDASPADKIQGKVFCVRLPKLENEQGQDF